MDPTCPGYTESELSGYLKALRTARVRMRWGTDMCDLLRFDQGQHSMVQNSTNNGALGAIAGIGVASNGRNITMYSDLEEFYRNLVFYRPTDRQHWIY
jgi:hypothetical protein